jgi:translation elongation factor EF-1beta
MAKKVAITIQLVQEADDIDNQQLKKEITKSLRCDWLYDVSTVDVTDC